MRLLLVGGGAGVVVVEGGRHQQPLRLLLLNGRSPRLSAKANLRQCEDRVHRKLSPILGVWILPVALRRVFVAGATTVGIGQKFNVTIHYVLAKKSLDDIVWPMITCVGRLYLRSRTHTATLKGRRLWGGTASCVARNSKRQERSSTGSDANE